MAPDLSTIKGHLEKRKEFSKIGNYKISISLQSSVDRIPISHYFPFPFPIFLFPIAVHNSRLMIAIANWAMIDLFTDCLRKFAKTYYMDVQNCGLMIIVAIG